MKCPHCGAPLGLEDEFCPYCNKPNELFKKHQEGMEQYEDQFQRTKSEVYTTVHKAASLTAPIVILLVLVVLNIAAAIFVHSSWDIARSIREDRIQQNLPTYQEALTDYLDSGDYYGFAQYYDQNELYLGDQFSSYQAVHSAARNYSYLYEILVNQTYTREWDFSENYFQDTLWRIADLIDTIYSTETSYNFNKELLLSSENLAYIQNIKEQTNAILLCYTNLTAEEVNSLADLSRSRQAELLERGLDSL